ncbi:uncharacterized protein MYCFIDRAFT_34761 [Pseudocercospora fijiensis CIRAD86]|uniref:Uncharacterized protein n=1 Tax=Pseudocercospora fijiensis (strain CIRAD86) TaxID=383855 RepID=M2YN55_PSEFD|nr:uncharacterized protein MYCFIDRAFT_34761 [Pseudocercospora fijiensis CIRAD86]EME79155.1 hypothetical protein MYCFIDRAFT_34761 [Pseudocercospora fijiensis CIRAD86]
MKVADFLSDLTSLQVCDPNAALALVSERPDNGAQANGGPVKNDDDQDLKRAKDLLSLHSEVKVAHVDGTDKELNQAREDVAKVLSTL